MHRILAAAAIILLTATIILAFWTGTVQDQLISQDDNMMGWYTRMAVDSEGNIHVVWNERIVNLPLQNEIHYSRSSDNGDTWSAINQDVFISFDDGVDANTNSDIAIDSDDIIYVVWPEDVIDIREIHYSISYDGGDTWTGQTRDTYLSLLGGTDALNPALAVDHNDVIHVVWNQDDPLTGIDEIYYSRSTDGGQTWSSQTAETIISYPDGQAASYPEIALGENNEIIVAWREADDVVTTNSVVNVSISTDGGDTWTGSTADIPLTLPFRMIYDPRIIVDSNGIVHSIWRGTQDQASPFHYEVYHSRSLDNGITWSGIATEQMVSYYPPGDYSCNIPNIGVDNMSNVVVVWDEDYTDDNNEIMVSASTDGGLSWSGETQDEIVSFPDNHPAYRPFVAAGIDGRFHVTWNEVTTTSYYQIHYSRGDALAAITGVFVTLAPDTLPIIIPAIGGTLNFNIGVQNTNPQAVNLDVWTMVTLPNGSEYGPLINFPDFNVPGNWSGNRARTQAVPATAPSGNYTYDAYVGNYPGVVYDEDHFEFSKSATGDGGGFVSDWNSWGESFAEFTGSEIQTQPESLGLLSAYPNPFNPATTINFELQAAGFMTLSVYDVQGREMLKLIDGYMNAGMHQVRLNAKDFVSGIYFARLSAGEFTQTQKLLLIK